MSEVLDFLWTNGPTILVVLFSLLNIFLSLYRIHSDGQARERMSTLLADTLRENLRLQESAIQQAQEREAYWRRDMNEAMDTIDAQRAMQRQLVPPGRIVRWPAGTAWPTAEPPPGWRRMTPDDLQFDDIDFIEERLADFTSVHIAIGNKFSIRIRPVE